MEQNGNTAAEPWADESASPRNPKDRPSLLGGTVPTPVADAAGAVPPRGTVPDTVRPTAPAALTTHAFDPVPLRYRRDGLTPAKQREYVEALADSGVARHAAAAIGVTEQAVARARRRADARSFDLACEAALRIGARRLRSIAFERAVEGTVRRHYYHGELKSEETVYDNRLLVYLLGKVDKLLEPPADCAAIAERWEPWMDAMEAGEPAPPLHDEPEPEAEAGKAGCGEPEPFDELKVWKEDGCWWTWFPPPAGFDGEEYGGLEEEDYRRTLSPAEQAVIDRRIAEEIGEEQAEYTVLRDRFFGFPGGDRNGEVFCPREAELYETSAPSGGPDPPFEALCPAPRKRADDG